MSAPVDTAVTQLRSDTSKLHKQLDEAFAKNETEMRKLQDDAATQAQQLASSLRKIAQEQQSETASRFASAAASLESAASSAKAGSQDALHYVRSALEDISHGVAAAGARSKQRA